MTPQRKQGKAALVTKNQPDKQQKPQMPPKTQKTPPRNKRVLVDVILRTFLGRNSFLPFRETEHFHYSVTVGE